MRREMSLYPLFIFLCVVAADMTLKVGGRSPEAASESIVEKIGAKMICGKSFIETQGW